MRRALLGAMMLVGFAAGMVRVPTDALADGQYVQLSQYYALPGQTVRAMGGNFAAGELVVVTLDGQTQTVTTQAQGTFETAAFSIPFGRGEYDLRLEARGERTGVATAHVRVGTFYPVITPSMWYVQPGSMVQFRGSGFAPGERVEVARAGQVLETATADAQGQLTTQSSMIPYRAGGALEYAFTGQQSAARTVVRIVVAQEQPYVKLDSYYVMRAQSVAMHAFAFGAGESVRFSIHGVGVGEATADAAGVAHHTGSVPTGAPSGSVEVRAEGQHTGKVATTQLTIAP